jgi:hypothetical protein
MQDISAWIEVFGPIFPLAQHVCVREARAVLWLAKPGV